MKFDLIKIFEFKHLNASGIIKFEFFIFKKKSDIIPNS